MKTLSIIVAFAALANTGPLGAAAEPAVSSAIGLTCPPSGGYIQGPFVPTAATARRAYFAIREAVAPDFRFTKRERLVVEDKSDHWEVSSVLHERDKQGGEVPLQGGGFGLDINKCTGAVSGVGGIR
jgi:hypothetical protein